MPITKTLSIPGHAIYVLSSSNLQLTLSISARYNFESLRSHKYMTYRLTHRLLITFVGVKKVGKLLANHTHTANSDDNDDSFITLDEVSVISWTVICQIITLTRP